MRRIFLRAARNLFEPFVVRLERLGVPSFVTGSMAGIVYGEPRMTHDVDIVVALSPREVRAFVDALPLLIHHDRGLRGLASTTA